MEKLIAEIAKMEAGTERVWKITELMDGVHLDDIELVRDKVCEATKITWQECLQLVEHYRRKAKRFEQQCQQPHRYFYDAN